jgi:hypothetical protein
VVRIHEEAPYAGVGKMEDPLDLGSSCSNAVRVRLSPPVPNADVGKLVDPLDLSSSCESSVSSTLTVRTIMKIAQVGMRLVLKTGEPV